MGHPVVRYSEQRDTCPAWRGTQPLTMESFRDAFHTVMTRRSPDGVPVHGNREMTWEEQLAQRKRTDALAEGLIASATPAPSGGHDE